MCFWNPANILILFKQIASVGGKITAVSVEHPVKRLHAETNRSWFKQVSKFTYTEHMFDVDKLFFTLNSRWLSTHSVIPALHGGWNNAHYDVHPMSSRIYLGFSLPVINIHLRWFDHEYECGPMYTHTIQDTKVSMLSCPNFQDNQGKSNNISQVNTVTSRSTQLKVTFILIMTWIRGKISNKGKKWTEF